MRTFSEIISRRCLEHEPSWQARLNEAIAYSNKEAAARGVLNSNIAVNGYGEAHVAEMERRIADIAAIAINEVDSIKGDLDPGLAEQATRDVASSFTVLPKDLWTSSAASKGLSNPSLYRGLWEQSQARIRSAIDTVAAASRAHATKKNAQITRDIESTLQTDSQMRTASQGSRMLLWTIISVLIAGFATLMAYLKNQ